MEIGTGGRIALRTRVLSTQGTHLSIVDVAMVVAGLSEAGACLVIYQLSTMIVYHEH